MKKNCLTCIHKDVCIKRSMTVFLLYIQTGRYNEVEDAKRGLDISQECEHWEEKK